MGLATHQISVEDLFVGNRQSLIGKLKEVAPSDTENSMVVYLRGGPSQERFDSDHEPMFRQVTRLSTRVKALVAIIISVTLKSIFFAFDFFPGILLSIPHWCQGTGLFGSY